MIITEDSSKLKRQKAEAQRRYIEKYPDRERMGYVKRRYNMEWEAYKEMYEEQKGACAICLCTLAPYRGGTNEVASVDHCHKTGEVRGLLCKRCNTCLGQVDDDTELLQRAINYLKKVQN